MMYGHNASAIGMRKPGQPIGARVAVVRPIGARY